MVVKCPKCGKKVAWEGSNFRPFCSERCKMLDLGAWASEDYKVSEKFIEKSDIKIYEEESD